MSKYIVCDGVVGVCVGGKRKKERERERDSSSNLFLFTKENHLKEKEE